MISTQNLIDLAPTVHYFMPLTRKFHMKFTGPPRSYLTFCKRKSTITKLSNSSITQNPRFSAPDAAHNSHVHTATIICVHALLTICPNRIQISPTHPPTHVPCSYHPSACLPPLVIPRWDKYSSFRSPYKLFLRYLWLVLRNERCKWRRRPVNLSPHHQCSFFPWPEFSAMVCIINFVRIKFVQQSLQWMVIMQYIVAPRVYIY
jgi:hypothetical protein